MGLKNVNGKPPNLNMMIQGIPIKGQMVIRRIPIKDIPIDDEHQCSQFLHKLYQEKVSHSCFDA